MKDFYSTEDSLPSVNKNDLKLDYYSAGQSIQDQFQLQSNSQKMQFYNNIQFPRKEEIKCQINNRSKRILSFSCQSDDTSDMNEKLNSQLIHSNLFNKNYADSSDFQNKMIGKSNIIDQKSHTENTVSRKYKMQLKDKIYKLQGAHKNKKSFSQQIQNQNESLSKILNNYEDEVQYKKKESIQIDNPEQIYIINNKESVLFPNFDQISPLEYRGNSSSLNSSIAQKQYSKGRDKFSLRSEIQQIGNMFVYKSELSQSKLPQLKDQFNENEHFGLRNSLVAINRPTFKQSQKNNKSSAITRQSTFEQEQPCNSQKQIPQTQPNEQDQLRVIQKKINGSDRKLAVLKVLKNKIKSRQNSLPATSLMIINSKKSQNELLDQDKDNNYQLNKIQNNESTFQTQIEQINLQQHQRNLQSSLIDGENNKSNQDDKNQLSRLLMKQQPLRLHEIRNKSQIILKQVSPYIKYSENKSPQKYQRKRINSQQSKSNIFHLLQKEIDDKSLVIKKGQADSQFIYPILNQNSQQNTKNNSPFKKDCYSPLAILRNSFDKEEEILKNCQQYIARLFKRREHDLKKKSHQKSSQDPIENSENKVVVSSIKQKIMKQDKILHEHLNSIERNQEDNFNKDFEQLQKYYDQKYQMESPQRSRQQKCQSPNTKEKSPEKRKIQQYKYTQDEDFNQPQEKKVRTKQNTHHQNEDMNKHQNFEDLKPWNDQEQNQTSFSFFHKTIFDQKQEKNIRKSQNHN